MVFFDNFFSSYSLLIDLTNKNIRACGSVRENRMEKCPLIATTQIKKQDRGSYDYRSDENIVCVKWNDNSLATVTSNSYGVNPYHTVTRKVKSENKK